MLSHPICIEKVVYLERDHLLEYVFYWFSEEKVAYEKGWALLRDHLVVFYSLSSFEILS